MARGSVPFAQRDVAALLAGERRGSPVDAVAGQSAALLERLSLRHMAEQPNPRHRRPADAPFAAGSDMGLLTRLLYGAGRRWPLLWDAGRSGHMSRTRRDDHPSHYPQRPTTRQDRTPSRATSLAPARGAPTRAPALSGTAAADILLQMAGYLCDAVRHGAAGTYDIFRTLAPTVDHVNADCLVRADLPATGRQLVTVTGQVPHGHRYTKTVHLDEDGGSPVVEQWTIRGAGHAWSGGRPDGTYADRHGPGRASAELVRFFAEHAGSRTPAGSAGNADDLCRTQPPAFNALVPTGRPLSVRPLARRWP